MILIKLRHIFIHVHIRRHTHTHTHSAHSRSPFHSKLTKFSLETTERNASIYSVDQFLLSLPASRLVYTRWREVKLIHYRSGRGRGGRGRQLFIARTITSVCFHFIVREIHRRPLCQRTIFPECLEKGERTCKIQHSVGELTL